MNGVGKMGMNQDRDSVSEWYVALPKNQDRGEYVHKCFLSGTVSLINSNGEYQHRVKIDKTAIQTVVFPPDAKTLGSLVLCLSAPYSGQLYVVGVFGTTTEWNDQTESTYRFFKAAGGTAELSVDGAGKISLSVDSEDDTSEVTVSVTSKNQAGKLKLLVNGDTLLQASGETQLISGKRVMVSQIDESGTTGVELTPGKVKAGTPAGAIVQLDGTDVKIITPEGGKITLNDSTEPVLLGAKTVQLLQDLLTQLSHETAGPYPLAGIATYAQLILKLDPLKSQIAFVK